MQKLNPVPLHTNMVDNNDKTSLVWLNYFLTLGSAIGELQTKVELLEAKVQALENPTI